MRRLTRREVDERHPPIRRCDCANCATAENMTFLISAIAYAPAKTRAALPANGYRIVGKLIETTITNDRIEDVGAFRFMNAVRPPIMGNREEWLSWRVHDSSQDKRTTWCRDLMLIVEAE
jgi:hypothetical protein